MVSDEPYKDAISLFTHNRYSIQKGKQMEKLYTRKEAANMLGISLSTLDVAKNTGAISYVQYVPNGSVFFTEAGLLEYVAKSTHQAAPTEKRDTYRKLWKRSKNGK